MSNTQKQSILHTILPVESGKVLCIPDIHLRDTPRDSMPNCLKIQEKIINELNAIIIKEKPTHIVLLGDLADKGYSEDEYKYAHERIINLWNRITNGRVILVIGNHMFIQSNTNPVYYWIQPHAKYRTKHQSVQGVPLLKTPESFRVGGVKFSLNHFDRENKNYFSTREDDVVRHVGLYHDDCVMPSSIRTKEHINIQVSNEYLQQVYRGIDHAIYGHIHTKYPTFKFNIGYGKDVLADVGGSLQITNTMLTHETSRLTMYEIDGDNYNISYIELPTHVKDLAFNTTKTERAMLRADMKKKQDLLSSDVAVSSLEYLESTNAVDYIRRSGLSQNFVDLYNLFLKTNDPDLGELLILARKEIKNE